MTVSRPNEKTEIYIHKDDGEILESKSHIKILGVTVNERNNLDTHINKMSVSIGLKYKEISHLVRYMNQDQRKIVMNAKLMSIVNFVSPLFLGQKKTTLMRLEVIIKRILRWTLKEPTYMVATRVICQKLQTDLPEQMILKNNLKYIHRIMTEGKVEQILNELKIPERSSSKIYMKNPSKETNKSSLEHQIDMYNALPNSLRILQPNKLKRKLRKSEFKLALL